MFADPIVERGFAARRKMFRTLIVEDNAVFRDSLTGMLEGQFSTMVVEKAASSEEALLKSSRFSPELIFVDIKLPGQNGLKLSKTLRSKYRKAVIVILTNHDEPEYRQAAIQSGANFFISKGGSSVEEILDVVGRMMRGERRRH
jgi:DNA-binding NarL/FixJ family response regulator